MTWYRSLIGKVVKQTQFQSEQSNIITNLQKTRIELQVTPVYAGELRKAVNENLACGKGRERHG